MSSASAYSQPKNSGGGQQRSTQLVIALDALKTERHPVSLEDFAIRHGVEQLLHDEELRNALKSNSKVIHNEKNNTYSWKPDHDIRTPNDLLRLVETRYNDSIPPQPLGFKLGPLKESFPAAKEAIEMFSKRRKRSEVEEEMRNEGGEGVDRIEHETKKILILPGTKEGNIRQVFFNEASGKEYIRLNGGKIIGTVDEEFKNLWHSLVTPDEVDLPKQLEQEGHMTATMVAGDVPNNNLRGRGRGRGKGRGIGRKVRIQNTHLEGVDLSSNYTG